jgi:xanthine dehydrogenase accessory factor
MYDVAEQVQAWVAGGRTVLIGQVVATRGFSSRDPGAALAWTDDDTVGGLMPVIDRELVGTVDGSRLMDVSVSDADAVAAGLSCGGRASVLVQPASDYPADLWNRLAARQPVCLVTELRDRAASPTRVFGPRDVRDAAQIPGAHDVPRLFARGTSATSLIAEGDVSLAAVALWPPTSLLVVGEGNIATALTDTAALLGWTSVVVNDAPSAVEIAGSLTESDAVVVLSHDRAVDVPALAAVLASRVGYVGGLGARGTQAARREGLLARDMSEEQLARIHGPAGLDIDAHTPAEIAVSIVAEILASRSGAPGGSISERHGPVHTGGVHAPPPR